MTNSINKMAGKNSVERCGGSASKAGVRGKRAGKLAAAVAAAPTTATAAHRQSPTGGRGSPRSPTIGTAQLFAGAKWTEPPSATALPPPPVHWTQHAPAWGPLAMRAAFCKSDDLKVVRSQLKMLLEAQA